MWGMRYGTVSSGISAETLAWRPLGWETVFFSEIAAFPSAVLKHHYPEVPNLGDMKKADWRKYHGSIDLISGGTPCQSLSIAGNREGLADPRGRLALVYLGIIDRLRPRWVVWENVPGVLSHDKGRTFGIILGTLGQLGYGFAYRVLDAQWFGVPQRRRRVFVIGDLGDWRPPAAVLFESEGMLGDPETFETTRPEIASPVTTRSGDNSRWGEGCCAFDLTQITSPTNRSNPKPGVCHTLPATGDVSVTLTSKGSDAPRDGNGIPLVSNTLTSTARLNRIDNGIPLVAGTLTSSTVKTDENGAAVGHLVNSLTAHGRRFDASDPYIPERFGVRRLTPREWERLQGFPDDYTLIPWKGKPAKDAPRYRAIGNSMAVPVVRRIGERIQQVEELIR